MVVIAEVEAGVEGWLGEVVHLKGGWGFWHHGFVDMLAAQYIGDRRGVQSSISRFLSHARFPSAAC